MKWPPLGDRRQVEREPDLDAVRQTNAELAKVAERLRETQRQMQAHLEALMDAER